MTTTEERIRQKIASTDWDAIDKQIELEDIGAEIYYAARTLEAVGQADSVGILSALMDGFRCNMPRNSRLDGKTGPIADGFAAAMVIEAANAVYPNNEEDE